MYTYLLIPFVLVLYYHVEKARVFPKEFVFNFNNTIVRQRDEDLEHIQMTSKLTCQSPSDEILRCFLENVRYITPNYFVKYKNSKYTKQVVEDDTKFDQTFWFEIYFNDHGAQRIRVKEDYKRIVKTDNLERQIIIDMIKDIAYLFKINTFNIGKNLIMHRTSGSSVFTSPTETSTIGNCETKYNMTVTFNKIVDKPPSIFQIIPMALWKISNVKDIYRYSHVQIEKDRPSCVYWSSFIDDDYSGTVTKHKYKMEMVNGQLRISNTISVRRSSSPENPLVLDKTTLLNLTDISYTQSELPYDWNDPYVWIHI